MMSFGFTTFSISFGFLPTLGPWCCDSPVDQFTWSHNPGFVVCFHGDWRSKREVEENFALLFLVNLCWHLLQALLHFIYWDELPDMQELAGLNSKGASTLMAQHLLAAADRYGLDRLRLLCEAMLCEDVAINSAATTLALAEQHHCIHLKAVCLKFIASRENLRAVMQTEGFEYLKSSCPSVLTELLEYVARINENSTSICTFGSDIMFDGSDINKRRVKQRIL